MKIPSCRNCKTELSVDVNWSRSRVQRCDYICRTCKSAQNEVYFVRKGGPASKYLYVISDDVGMYFKIGVANDPAFRLKKLQTGTPTRLRIETVVSNEPHLEYIMHKSLAHRHVRGEWFAR